MSDPINQSLKEKLEDVARKQEYKEYITCERCEDTIRTGDNGEKWEISISISSSGSGEQVIGWYVCEKCLKEVLDAIDSKGLAMAGVEL